MCNCGSGKKFKKCCFRRPTTDVQILSDIKSLVFADHKNYVPQRKSLVLYVVNSNNLPLIIRQKVLKYIYSEKLLRLGCWFNSSHLSLLEDDIQTVHGYYGHKQPVSQSEKYESMIKKHHIKPNKDGFYEINDNYGRGYYDKKNKIILHPHSWNRYQNIDFDLTKEHDTYYSNKWVYYYPVKTISTSSLQPGIKTECEKVISSFKNNHPKRILNNHKIVCLR